MTSQERQELILQKIKVKWIKVESGIPNKKYDSEEVLDLIHILIAFIQLREKDS